MKSKILKIIRAVRHPIRSLRRKFPKPPHLKSDKIFKGYGKLAMQKGLSELYIILSFDCDTPEDIKAADHLHIWLTDREIKATYAVPGEQLKQGAKIYRKIKDQGGEFINHGGRPHTEWINGMYQSTTFYDKLSAAEVVEDIKNGHKIIEENLGVTPIGFRAPHFGTIHDLEKRKLIYSTLKEMKYKYSTSTLPKFGFDNGPITEVGGVYEIPLSGSYVNPFTILDSWNNIESPENPVIKDEYGKLFIQTVNHLLKLKINGVLNYYVDPAHVYKSSAFYKAIDYIGEKGIQTLHYDDLIRITKKI